MNFPSAPAREDPSCARCGAPAHAKLEGPGGRGWYGSRRYDTADILILKENAVRGYLCDSCGKKAEADGEIVVVGDHDGPFPPSALGEHAAVALFERGATTIIDQVRQPLHDRTTLGLTLSAGKATITDLTQDHVPLPAFMSACEPLYRRFSASYGRSLPNRTDFESLGRLYALVMTARGDDVGADGMRAAGLAVFRRELLLERQVEVAKQHQVEFEQELRGSLDAAAGRPLADGG